MANQQTSRATGGSSKPKQDGNATVGGSEVAPTGNVLSGGGGGGIVVTHTTRQLRAYNFTESDLDTIGLANVVSGVAFSISAAIFTFCIDLNKDLLLSPTPIPEAYALQFTVNWGGIPIAIILAAVGGAALFKRGGVIKRVKEESQNVNKP